MNEMLTKNQVVDQIKKMIPIDFNMSIEDLKKEILKTVEFGTSKHFKSKNGYEVFYTNNTNFMQGEKNGGGSGFFINLRYCGFIKCIKLK